MKQVVAINNIYQQIIRDERSNMKDYIKDENMIQDILTRRILEQNKFNDDEEVLERGAKSSPQA